jgi:hypothetical protein
LTCIKAAAHAENATIHWTHNKGQKLLPSRIVVAISLTFLIGGCGLSRSVGTGTIQNSGPMRTIAVVPGGRLLADAVSIELSKRGYSIIDAASTSNLMVRFNLNEAEITRPEALTRFRDQGIDAILTVRTAAGYDGRPQSASARLNNTRNGALLSGATWENAWGGAQGSVADSVMRRGLSSAASDIATQLTGR